jgi:hypothetical protein
MNCAVAAPDIVKTGMTSLNSEEFKDWYRRMPDSDKMIFLALVMGRLTIHGRAFGLDLSGEEQTRAFKGLNELFHQISNQFEAIGVTRDRYPDDIFLRALMEKASFYGLQAQLTESLNYSRTRHEW